MGNPSVVREGPLAGGRDWSAEVGLLISQIAGNYLDPGAAEDVCRLLRGRLAGGAYRDLADEKALAQAVNADIDSVSDDLHLGLRYSKEEIPATGDAAVDTGALQAERVRLEGHGFTRVERLAGNIALLEIRALPDPARAGAGTVAAAAMQLVASADALIIDLRRNRGGEPEMVALVSSYLFSERTHLVDLRFPASGRTLQYWTSPFVPGPVYGGSKPVYVLISGKTFSAGEGLSYQLRQCGRAVLVGETTAGAANFHYPLRVSAHLFSAVPSGYPVDPVSGANWEGTGVRPDVPVAAGQALDAACRLALEHALTLGSAGARDVSAGEAARALAALPGPGNAARGR